MDNSKIDVFKKKVKLYVESFLKLGSLTQHLIGKPSMVVTNIDNDHHNQGSKEDQVCVKVNITTHQKHKDLFLNEAPFIKTASWEHFDNDFEKEKKSVVSYTFYLPR